MHIAYLKYFLFIVFIQFFQYKLMAQNKDMKIEFTHVNDLYFITDKYYSAGNHLSFASLIKGQKQGKTILSFKIGQNIYTPSKKSKPDTSRFDRPFAGWLFLKTEFTKAATDEMWSVGIEFGLTGPQSKGDKVQRNYHRLINEQLPSWHQQIPNDIHANINFEHQKNLINKHLLTHSNLSLGTKDIFAEAGLEWFWGSHYNFAQNTYKGIPSHQDKEWFISLGGFYRYVFYNALIEGSLFNDDAIFTKDIQNNLGLFRLRGFYRWNNKSIDMTYHFNTKEIKETTSFSNLSISISHYF